MAFETVIRGRKLACLLLSVWIFSSVPKMIQDLSKLSHLSAHHTQYLDEFQLPIEIEVAVQIGLF
jgi:hypothetical protein